MHLRQRIDQFETIQIYKVLRWTKTQLILGTIPLYRYYNILQVLISLDLVDLKLMCDTFSGRMKAALGCGL